MAITSPGGAPARIDQKLAYDLYLSLGTIKASGAEYNKQCGTSFHWQSVGRAARWYVIWHMDECRPDFIDSINGDHWKSNFVWYEQMVRWSLNVHYHSPKGFLNWVMEHINELSPYRFVYESGFRRTYKENFSDFQAKVSELSEESN